MGSLLRGSVLKPYDDENGFGFIDCKDVWKEFGRDVYIHRKAKHEGVVVGDLVSFTIHLNANGHPQVNDVEAVAEIPGQIIEARNSERSGERSVRKFVGTVKCVDLEKCYGLIECEKTRAKYNRDVYFAQDKADVDLSTLSVGEHVSFLHFNTSK